jgi:ribosomal protein L29
MKLKDKKEIFTKPEKELKKLLSEAREELFKLNMELSQRKLKNTRQIFWKKKQIAMILTALTQAKLAVKEEVKNG